MNYNDSSLMISQEEENLYNQHLFALTNKDIPSNILYEEVQKILLGWEEAVDAIHDTIWNDPLRAELYHKNIQLLLFRLWRVMDATADGVGGLSRTTVIGKYYPQQWIFKKIFDDQFAIDSIDLVSVCIPNGLKEATVIDKTIVLNLDNIIEWSKVNSLYTKSNEKQYRSAVCNNEVMHLYLMEQYGQVTHQGNLLLWGIVLEKGVLSYTCLQASEFLSDVAAIMTDINYLATPVSLWLQDQFFYDGWVNTKNNYMLSIALIFRAIEKVFENDLDVLMSLENILHQWQNTQEPRMLAEAMVTYLRTLYANLDDNKINQLQNILLSQSKIIIKQYDQIQQMGN